MLTSSTTSVLRHEPGVLAPSEEDTLLFSELHSFPRHFKPRKEGILARIANKSEYGHRELKTRCFPFYSSGSFSLCFVLFSSPHDPVKKIREDVFK